MIDTNNDGKLDIINFGNPGGGDHALTTYLGDGAGGFTLGASTVIGYYPSRSFGDLNGDNRPDVVMSWNGNVRLRLMQADGSLASTQLSTGTFGFIRDFDNDGKNDVLIWVFQRDRAQDLIQSGKCHLHPGPGNSGCSGVFPWRHQRP